MEYLINGCCKTSKRFTNLTIGSGTVVKHSPHHHKIEGLNPGTATGTGRIKIERKPGGTLEWTQPTLTQSILKDLKLDGEEIKGRQNKPNIKSVPANTSVPLTDHRESPDHNPKDFEYRHVIGKLLYLEKSTRPDI